MMEERYEMGSNGQFRKLGARTRTLDPLSYSVKETMVEYFVLDPLRIKNVRSGFGSDAAQYLPPLEQY